MGRLQVSFDSNLGHRDGDDRVPFFGRDNLFVVAEGLGETDPEVRVEEMVCQMICESFFGHLSKSSSPRDSLLSAIEETHGEIFDRREKLGEKLVIFLSVIFVEENLMYFAQLGNSRIYAFRKGELTQLTRDQTITKEVLHQGPAVKAPPPRRTFVLGLGALERPEIRVKKFVLQKRDLIILTTPGLTSRISNGKILKLSSKTRNSRALCNRLIEEAERRGKGKRNLTVGVLRQALFTPNQKRMILAGSALALLLLWLIGLEALPPNRKGGPGGRVQSLKPGQGDSVRAAAALADQRAEGWTDPQAGDPPPSAEEAKPERPVEINREIEAFLSEWRAAWEDTARGKGGIEHYISFYSGDFHANGLDKSGWKRDKAEKGKGKTWIRVELKEIRIGELGEDNRIEVRFLQRYRSSNYSGRFNKRLLLKRKGGEWKIITEETV